tara:strand:- start:93 stop:437 length:345 start_codon:yes stop_codon:yes gene_type:complete
MASSLDGIVFNPKKRLLTAPYLKIENIKNEYYGITMLGLFYKFKNNFKNYELRKKWLLDSKTTHSDLMVDKNILYLVYTRIGDKPESILYWAININLNNWNDWKAGSEKNTINP